jgi:hypothetical protein
MLFSNCQCLELGCCCEDLNGARFSWRATEGILDRGMLPLVTDLDFKIFFVAIAMISFHLFIQCVLLGGNNEKSEAS